MAVFVSGGTGYIGSKLVAALVRSGEEVHVLLRKESDRTGLDHPRIRLFEGNILDEESVRRAIRGCTAAYHLAAYARVWAPSPEVFIACNVGGLRHVLNACVLYGVHRVVFTSSVMTIGPSTEGVVNESTVRTCRFLTDYEESKRLAEQEAAEYGAQGLEVVIVNPTRVYGPGKLTEANAVTRMIALYAKGRFPLLLSRGEQIGNYVFVDDVVNGHLLAMEKGEPGERYILGGENVRLKQFFDVVREVIGVHKVQMHVPAWIARTVGLLEESRARVFHSSPFIARGWVDTFLQDWAVSSQKAVDELGYRFCPLREGISRTWKWLVDGTGHSILQKI